jgi:glycosyltransferase involved in cell wall biosynthesis
MLKSFAVVIPSFNNARWCQRNLESVLNQQYSSFRAIYIDDASTDDTALLVAEYLAESEQAHRVKFQRNQVRVGPLANIDQAIRSCDPEEIIVLVDGDDLLAHPQVLTRLNMIYQDPDIWLTWGQFTRFPPSRDGFCAPIPDEVVSASAFRDYPFVSSHLRTFYARLYQRIRLVDVQDSDGQFFTIAGDVAQMFALHEMAGPHGRFVAEVLYRYNRENPLNDDKLDRRRQVLTELKIREKARYGRLRKLDGISAPSEFCVSTEPGRNLFGTPGPLPNSEHSCRPFRQLRSVLNRLGFTVRETQTLSDLEDPHTIVVFDVRPDELERLGRYPKNVATLVMWKDPISAPCNFEVKYHQPFQRIYTWCDDLVDNIRYFKLHFPFLRPMTNELVPFEERRLCVLNATSRHSDHCDELHTEERKVADFFAQLNPVESDSFDLFGEGWDPGVHRNYRGISPTQANGLGRYLFSFCYEAVRRWNGLVTGKLFDSFAAGCVPIYWGAPNIASSIPAGCFIAREAFSSEAELYAFLKDMPAEVHDGYLRRIRAFLSSEQAIPYSAEHFIRTFVGLIARPKAPRANDPFDYNGAALAPSRAVAGARDARERE